jgi:hypothetical protein
VHYHLQPWQESGEVKVLQKITGFSCCNFDVFIEFELSLYSLCCVVLVM